MATIYHIGILFIRVDVSPVLGVLSVTWKVLFLALVPVVIIIFCFIVFYEKNAKNIVIHNTKEVAVASLSEG